MTDARSTYDESNEVWPYFVLTILSVVLIPTTLAQLGKLYSKEGRRNDLKASHARFRASKQRKDALSSTKVWLVSAGWVLFASLLYFIRTTDGDGSAGELVEVWDPYKLLGISLTATEREIKKAYFKLSLQFHPDKAVGLVESAKELANARYMEITKAYRALTDETTRENFLLYGHPDGPQPVVHGIALPAFLFDPAGSLAFVTMYLLGFGLFVPFVVGKWWTASQVRTRRGLLQATAAQFCQLLAKEQAHFITTDRILKEVLTSADMDDALRSELVGFEARREKLDAYLRRAASQDHLELTVAVETARLLMGLHDFASEFKSVSLCHRLITMHRSVVQAVPLNISSEAEYAQLRGANLDDVLDKKPNHGEVMEVALKAREYLPRLHLLKAEFKVSGEDAVTVNSRVFLQLKFLVLPLGDKVPEISEQELEAVSDIASSLELVEPALRNKKQPALPNAVTPYFPLDVPVRWYAYVHGDIDQKLAEKPLEIANMDLHNLKLSREQVAQGDGLVIGVINVPFAAAIPPQPGNFPFRVSLLSASYFGTDIRTRVTMNVVDPPPREAVSADDDELDLDEHDSDGESSEEEIEGLSDIDTSTEEEDNADEEKH